MERAKRRCGIIPQEIAQEILVKLPVKSIVRFKAVSKEWRGTIDSTFFIEKQIEYQKSLQGREARIVLFSREVRYNGLALENVLVSDKGIVPVSPYLPIRSFNRFDGYKITKPCDGLFCIYTKTRIFNLVNPATTSRRRLPNPTSTIAEGWHIDYTLLGIGRENSASRRYKLVWFFECDNREMNESTRCKVFPLESNTWRYIDPPRCRVYYHHPLIHLDGAIYCFSYSMENQCSKEELTLLAFDLHKETFQSFTITPEIGSIYCRELSMRILNYRLCIFKRFVYGNDRFCKMWGLNINKRSWEIMYSIDMSYFPAEYLDQSSIGLMPLYRIWSIIPIAVINNYLIIANGRRNIWVLDVSKGCILYHTMSIPNHLDPCFVMSYLETLVSTY